MKAPLPSMQIPHSHHFRPRRGSWLRQQHDRLNTAERIAPLERSDPDLEVLAFFFQGTDPRFQAATFRIKAGDAALEVLFSCSTLAMAAAVGIYRSRTAHSKLPNRPRWPTVSKQRKRQVGAVARWQEVLKVLV